MEQQHQPERYNERRDITIYLKSTDLVPDDADFARRCDQLREKPDERLAFSFGRLIVNMEGIAVAITEGDGRQLAWHVRSGLASIAAYETVTAEQREENNVANSTVSKDTS